MTISRVLFERFDILPIGKKVRFVFFFAVVALHGYSQETNVVITGNVVNPQNKTVRLSVKEMFTKDAELVSAINDKGEFSFRYFQKYPHNNTIEYNGKMYRFIVAPNDSVHIVFANGNISFSGSNASLNAELQDLTIRNEYFLVSEAQQTLSPTAYKKRIREIYAETDSLLANYYNAHHSSIGLRQWADTYYTYRMYDDMMRYSMFNEDKELPTDYYDFLNETKLFPTEWKNKEVSVVNGIFDESAFISSSTNDVVEEIGSMLLRKTRALIPKGSKDLKAYKTHIEVIATETSGQMREIQLAFFFSQMLELNQYDIVEDNLSAFYTYVKNEALRSYVLNAYDQTKKYLKSDYKEQYLASMADDEQMAPLVDSILTKHTGKVLYIDVWGVWCGPSLGEMKYARALKKKLEGSEVVFVYLCVDSEESAWKSTIKEYDISGDHYLLNQDQYNILVQRFKMKGVPHYILVDKKGKIVPNEAPCPSDGGCLKQIQALLK